MTPKTRRVNYTKSEEKQFRNYKTNGIVASKVGTMFDALVEEYRVYL